MYMYGKRLARTKPGHVSSGLGKLFSIFKSIILKEVYYDKKNPCRKTGAFALNGAE
jgi:hypothetical protein